MIQKGQQSDISEEPSQRLSLQGFFLFYIFFILNGDLSLTQAQNVRAVWLCVFLLAACSVLTLMKLASAGANIAGSLCVNGSNFLVVLK